MMNHMQDEKTIRLTVLSPEGTKLDETVAKVTLPASRGRFMVLYNHAPVITSLDEGDIVYESGGKEGRMHVVSGFAEVNANTVVVCAEVR